MFEYVGALHIHSVFSDGSGEVKEIAAFADEAGLDFIILTDHNTIRALKENYEGWYGKTLLLVGCEINDKENKNHLLALNIKEAFSTRYPAKEYVKKVKDAGGLGFLAHPHEKRNFMKEHPPYPWTEWDTDDFTGIEIWNHMSQWMEGLTEQNKYNYFIHPLKSVTNPPQESLDVWDEISQKRRVVGIGGIDAHAHKINLLGFFEVEVFPYKVLFKSVRTHVLTDFEIKSSPDKTGLEEAKNEIYKSLELGRCFVSNYYQGDAAGFRFFAEYEKDIFQMGDSIALKNEIKLKAVLPCSGKIKFLRNGGNVGIFEGNSAELIVKEKGAYRVEVYINEYPWIFSNHIRIGL
jgi:hypothetical protein